jgi:PKD repeat protein
MCKDSAKKEIVIYPQIIANFLPQDSVGCHPLLTPFRNLSSGNVTDSSYYWEFGDGNSSVVKNPLHNYQNLFSQNDTTFDITLIATSPY